MKRFRRFPATQKRGINFRLRGKTGHSDAGSESAAASGRRHDRVHTSRPKPGGRTHPLRISSPPSPASSARWSIRPSSVSDVKTAPPRRVRSSQTSSSRTKGSSRGKSARAKPRGWSPDRSAYLGSSPAQPLTDRLPFQQDLNSHDRLFGNAPFRRSSAQRTLPWEKRHFGGHWCDLDDPRIVQIIAKLFHLCVDIQDGVRVGNS